ncbi:MAG: hypothetical protein ACRDLF_10960 [Solirubrobacteraceae bacterium]
MTFYNVVLFLHITSVICMFGCLTADWLGIAGLRRSESAGPASAWIRALEVSGAIGPGARFAVLGAGLYLAVDAWSWQGWIIVGLVSWVVYVVLGEPLTGRELRELTALVRREHGKLSPQAIARLRHPRMWHSVLIRVGLGAGIVFCMAVKPETAVAAVVVAIGALTGLTAAQLASRPGGTGRRRQRRFLLRFGPKHAS